MTGKCIICKESGGGPLSVASHKSLETIKSFSENWAKIGRKFNILNRVRDLIFSEDAKYGYHRKCYQSLCHQGHLVQAQKKYEEEVASAAESKKRGRASVEASSSKTRKTFDQELCVFCQSSDNTAVHSVSSSDMGKKFLAIKEVTKSNEIQARLAFLYTDKDAFAQNMKYHINCLRKETRAISSSTSSTDNFSERDNIITAICDIEIAQIVEFMITEDSELEFPSIDMNSIQDTYKFLLEEQGVKINPKTLYKQHIKNILLEKIPSIDFAKRGPKPEIVFSTGTKEKLMAQLYDGAKVGDEVEVLFKASQIIRREIANMEDWQFTGSFDDYSTPLKLQQFLKWVISGPHTNLSATREKEIETSSRNLAQHIVSSFRSRRQVTYKAKTDSKFRKAKKTPLTVGLSLTSYQANRARSEIETLNNLQFAVTYDEVERMTTRMALAIIDDINANTQGVHMPSFVKRGIRPLFAIDNIDLGSEAGSFHGADLLIAQREDDGVPLLGKDLKLDLNVHDKALNKSLHMPYIDCGKPANPSVSHTNYKLDTLKEISTNYGQCDFIWLLMCGLLVAQRVGSPKDDVDSQLEDESNLDDSVESSQEVTVDRCVEPPVMEQASSASTSAPSEPQHISQDFSTCATRDVVVAPPEKSQKVPTWSTFNSLINERTPTWNVGIVAPLYRRSPTEWPVLLTILKHAQKLNCITAGEGQRPIITLDGDLYDRAVKLKDYKTNWCIRLGGLHITMAALKCLGKYVEGSGIDLAWEESSMYGSATVRQILDGRHIYRSIEAHTVTLVALFTLYMQVVFSDEEREGLEEQIIKTISTFALYAEGKTDYMPEAFQSQVSEVHQTLCASDMFKRLNGLKEQTKGISRFLKNYMDQVEVLLMFTAATRTCNWKLHLAAMEELLPYFHAHDQYNYGRWGPLYVADMLELQSTDPEIWKFLDGGNFAITKHKVPFTAIDPDHGIEQEHRKMKIKAGFIGITGNENALEKYFIIAPTLCKIVQEFKEYAGIETRKPSSLHHELVGAKSTRLIANAANFVRVITRQGNPFLKSDMFNLVTFAVVPGNVCNNIEDRDKLGREALEKFVSTRMIDKTVNFWDAQKKNNWSYFKDAGATVQTKVNGQLVSIKQERKLLSRLLVAAKSRTNFVVKDAIGDFEFSVAPPSNFHPDGSMIMLSDKSKVVSSILNIPLPDGRALSEPASDVPSVLVIDAMCIVNMVPKTPEMSKALHFALKFVDIVAGMSDTYDEVRIVFDQYISGSLKETTRDKRTVKTTPIHYHVNDDTEIKNMKVFLSHINTKAELTKYLSDKLISYFQGKAKRVLVMHHTTMEASCPLSDMVSMPEMAAGQHNLEEGDQLVLLNAFDVMHKNPQSILDVFSVDSDVFVLLLGHFPMLPKSTTLLRQKGERISIEESYVRLGCKRAEALIGWYAFKGTDNTGSFAGKGVVSHFKAFMQADADILNAFAAFGQTQKLPSYIIDQMERYLCELYKTGDLNESVVRELRWALFAQKGKEGQQLPPTRGTLVPHTSRAYYMALVWKLSKTPCPHLPSPTDYSWQSTGGRLKPVFCLNAPAPEALLELIKCSCKTGCMRKSCGCKKNELICTDLCGCGDTCQNVVQDKPVEIDEAD